MEHLTTDALRNAIILRESRGVAVARECGGCRAEITVLNDRRQLSFSEVNEFPWDGCMISTRTSSQVNDIKTVSVRQRNPSQNSHMHPMGLWRGSKFMIRISQPLVSIYNLNFSNDCQSIRNEAEHLLRIAFELNSMIATYLFEFNETKWRRDNRSRLCSATVGPRVTHTPLTQKSLSIRNCTRRYDIHLRSNDL